MDVQRHQPTIAEVAQETHAYLHGTGSSHLSREGRAQGHARSRDRAGSRFTVAMARESASPCVWRTWERCGNSSSDQSLRSASFTWMAGSSLRRDQRKAPLRGPSTPVRLERCSPTRERLYDGNHRRIPLCRWGYQHQGHGVSLRNPLKRESDESNRPRMRSSGRHRKGCSPGGL